MTRTRTSLALLTVLTALHLSACEDLPAGDKTTPEYWSELFLNIYADELIVGPLEPGPGALAQPRAVLLITGVTIRAQWFDPIVARLQRDGFVPYVYEPPNLLSGSLFQASEDLGDVVQEVLAQSGQDRIDILAECTGGVIARHYIQSLGGAQYVSRLVTFVSPHSGITKAPLAAMIAGWPALYDLSPGSEFLQAVNGVALPAGVPVTSIYTCSDLYIQPWQGSIVPGARNIGLCDGTVDHFQTFYDPAIYAIMHAALTEPLPGEAAADPSDPASGPASDPASDPATDPGTEPSGGFTPPPAPRVLPEPNLEPSDATSAVPVGAAPGDRAGTASGSPASADPAASRVIVVQLGADGSAAPGCTAGGRGGLGTGVPALALALMLVWRRRARRVGHVRCG